MSAVNLDILLFSHTVLFLPIIYIREVCDFGDKEFALKTWIKLSLNQELVNMSGLQPLHHDANHLLQITV